MTREEAIKKINAIKKYLTAGNPIWDVREIEEVLDMAIEALRAEATGSCEGCAYIAKDVSEEPCNSCTRCCTDNYTAAD